MSRDPGLAPTTPEPETDASGVSGGTEETRVPGSASSMAPADRAAAFASANDVDRAALFAAGPTPIPRRAVVIALCAVLVLGLGGTLLEHVLSGTSLNPRAARTAPPKTPPPALPSLTAPLPGTGSQEPVTAALPAFMGLQRLVPAPAHALALVDQHGQPASLGQLHGSVVVLSFFDGPCNDICPVLATEIRQADNLLGSRSADVEFLTVNTDPTALAVSDLSPAVAAGGLGSMQNWRMLTGPLPTLNTVWRDYRITVTANTVTKAVAHNDLLYFIDPSGKVRYRATPIANEQADGSYSLGPGDVSRWAQGIATYAGALVGG